MRFLADEMLTRLARLLRAAGYDTALARQGAPDEALLAQAQREGRLLLTRDRRLAERAGALGVRILGESATDQARGLSDRLVIDWLKAPFSRCVMDNAELSDATPADIARMPPQARGLPGPFRRCPACGRLYWPGSHVRRMAERLAGLARD
jgi:uncharacterized protein with PIN domain